MKHNVPENVGKVLKDIGMTSRQAGWDCHGTYVLLHKALEKVAAHQGITFDPPEIIQCDMEKKLASIMVVGRLGDKTEWSIGEAAPYNNKNSYPFAMAEKRAKDRVILKLVGLHGDVYSEEEADAFKEAKPPSINMSVAPLEPEPEPEMPAESLEQSLPWQTMLHNKSPFKDPVPGQDEFKTLFCQLIAKYQKPTVKQNGSLATPAERKERLDGLLEANKVNTDRLSEKNFKEITNAYQKSVELLDREAKEGSKDVR